MTRIRFIASAIASAALIVTSLQAARPHYGGTIAMQTNDVVGSLDPSAVDAAGAATRERLLPLVFETLVTVDGAGGLRPLLATAWEHDAQARQWRFHLRPQVVLHDRSILDAPRVAAVLSARERAWTVLADGDGITIADERAPADLPWAIADSSHAIAIRTASGALVGSGPFTLDRLEPARIMLRAHDDYWGGRPFVDGVQISQGRPSRERLAGLESGRADLAPVAPTDLRRLADRGLRTAASRPLILYVLVFEPHRTQAPDDGLRTALAASIDRAALSAVVLQRQAEPADGLLPAWISGYEPLLGSTVRPASPLRPAIMRQALVLRIDPGDPLARPIAERLAVDARARSLDVSVQAPVGLAPRPDVRLVRVTLPATTPDRALGVAMQAIGARATAVPGGPPPPGSPLAIVFNVERSVLRYNTVIPVVHVDELLGIGDRIETWNEPSVSPSGAWNLASVWLRADRPASR